MAVTDPCIVAHLANGVLFVVGAEMTSRHAAARALEQLEHAKTKPIGAVLNRVDLQHNAYYYSQVLSPGIRRVLRRSGSLARGSRGVGGSP